MNRFQRIRRFAGVLTAVTAGLLASGAWTSSVPRMIPDPGGAGAGTPAAPVRTVVHTVIVGGMPGWEITLIAVAAAVAAATVSALLVRMRTVGQRAARREPATASA